MSWGPSGLACSGSIVSVPLPPVIKDTSVEVGWLGKEALLAACRGPGHLLRWPNTPICSLTTPLGEESLIVPGYLKIACNASQSGMRRRKKHWCTVEKNSQGSFLKGGGGDPHSLSASTGTKLQNLPWTQPTCAGSPMWSVVKGLPSFHCSYTTGASWEHHLPSRWIGVVSEPACPLTPMKRAWQHLPPFPETTWFLPFSGDGWIKPLFTSLGLSPAVVGRVLTYCSSQTDGQSSSLLAGTCLSGNCPFLEALRYSPYHITPSKIKFKHNRCVSQSWLLIEIVHCESG